MSELTSNAPSTMSKGKRTVFVYAVLILYAAFSASALGLNVALPERMLEMDAMGFYALAAAIGNLGMMLALPLVGKLCDMFGTKRVALFGIALQLITRLIMIETRVLPVFLALYALSTIGIGLYLTAPFVMFAEVLTPEDRAKYYGMLVTFKALGALSGPLITGWLMDNGLGVLSFISYIPFLVLSVPFIIAFYPNNKTSRTAGVKFDFAGVFLLVISITCIIFFLSLGGKSFEWISPIGIALLFGGVVGFAGLLRIENKHPNPSVAIRMFKKKRFAIAFLSAMFVSAFATVFGAYIIVYIQQVMQLSSTVSATAGMPQTIGQAIFGVIFGRFLGKAFVERFRPAALFSLFLVALGTALICTLQPTSSMLIIYVASALGGIGTVVSQSSYSNFFQTELKPEEISAAQGMFSFGGTGGSCIFVAIAGAIINAGATINHAFMMATVWCAVSLLIGFIGFRLPQEQSKTATN